MEVVEGGSNKWMTEFLKDEKNIQASAQLTVDLRVSTPSPSLNWALSSGFRKGYTTCLYGPEGGGKSLTSMIAAGSLMQANPDEIVVLISTEMRPINPEKLRNVGVDPSRLMIRQVNTLHDVFDWISSADESFKNSDGSKGGPGLLYMLKKGAPIGGLIIDSIKAIQGPKEQRATSAEDDYMGDLSKYLNPALRKILPIIREHNLMTLFVQQVNENMDINEVKYQNKKWLIPSGQALKHFCETMALVQKVTKKDSKIFDESMESIRGIAVQSGHTVRLTITKANLDSPNREAEFQIKYLEGIVNTGHEVAVLAANLGILSNPISENTGKPIKSQWIFKDGKIDKKWIGIATAMEEVENTPELKRSILAKIYKM